MAPSQKSHDIQAAAAILSGGQARRMAGADKAWLEVAGRSIVHRQLEVLEQRFDAIAMVVADRGETRDLHLTALGDRVGGLGPLDGIASALAWSPQEWVLVIANDMPNVSLAVIDALLSARRSGHQIVGTIVENRAQPLLALYHTSLLPTLDELLGQGRQRASALLSSPPAGVQTVLLPESQIRRIDPHLLSFQNLNSPEDLLPSPS